MSEAQLRCTGLSPPLCPCTVFWREVRVSSDHRWLCEGISLAIECILILSFTLSMTCHTSTPSSFSFPGKPSGLKAGRKLKSHRRDNRWASKKYNKSHSVTAMKANPMGGTFMPPPLSGNSHPAPSCQVLKSDVPMYSPLSASHPHQAHACPRDTSWRRSALRPSSPTRPSVRVSVCSLSRTERRLHASSPEMVA